MNDKERSQWIDNDEGLYAAWKRSKLSKKRFVATNRKEIDRIIELIVSGKKRSHFLVYG
jgi:hypothetical protein